MIVASFHSYFGPIFSWCGSKKGRMKHDSFSAARAQAQWASCHAFAAVSSSSVGDAGAGADSMLALSPSITGRAHHPAERTDQPTSPSATITPSFSSLFHTIMLP